MREILFRGKRKDTGEWIYGNLIFMTPSSHTMSYEEPTAVIMPATTIIAHGDIWGDFWFVDISTIGQFTGLTDKNGEKIFEGDIAAQFYRNTDKVKRRLVVKFIPDRGGWYPFASGDGCGCCEDETVTPADDGRVVDVQVVGNIHDDPELLEELKK